MLHEVCGVLIHEHVHALQHDAPESDDPTKGGLIEGIADYCRLKAGLGEFTRYCYRPDLMYSLGAAHWNENETGDSWDAGYE